MQHSNDVAPNEEVIVFDNLFRPAETIGDLESIKAKQPAPFHNTNAPGELPSFDNVESIFELGTQAGQNFRGNFA